MSRRFDLVTVKSDKPKEGEITFHLDGFDKGKGHTANASVSGDRLTVTAQTGSSSYRAEFGGMNISSAEAKLKHNQIDVVVRKKSPFNLEDKIN